MGKYAAIFKGRPIYEPPLALDLSGKGVEGQRRRTMGMCNPGQAPTGPQCTTGSGHTPGNCQAGNIPNQGLCRTGTYPNSHCLGGSAVA